MAKLWIVYRSDWCDTSISRALDILTCGELHGPRWPQSGECEPIAVYDSLADARALWERLTYQARDSGDDTVPVYRMDRLGDWRAMVASVVGEQRAAEILRDVRSRLRAVGGWSTMAHTIRRLRAL